MLKNSGSSFPVFPSSYIERLSVFGGVIAVGSAGGAASGAAGGAAGGAAAPARRPIKAIPIKVSMYWAPAVEIEIKDAIRFAMAFGEMLTLAERKHSGTDDDGSNPIFNIYKPLLCKMLLRLKLIDVANRDKLAETIDAYSMSRKRVRGFSVAGGLRLPVLGVW